MSFHQDPQAASTLRSSWPICLALAAWASWIYGPLFGADFIRLDDNLYVTENLLVRSGLSWPPYRRHTARSSFFASSIR